MNEIICGNNIEVMKKYHDYVNKSILCMPYEIMLYKNDKEQDDMTREFIKAGIGLFLWDGKQLIPEVSPISYITDNEKERKVYEQLIQKRERFIFQGEC